MGRKIAIVGTAPSSYELAPFEDPEWEIWGTSRLYHAISRWDVWFELHDLERIGSGWNADARGKKEQREKHLEWLKNQTHPIYVQHETDRIPAGIAYPLDDVLEYLGTEFGADERYLTNHISYMLALAIYEARAGDVERIGVWGVDMALDSEWSYQRPSCEYLIGIARGAGLDVYIPPESDLLKAMHLYGYESNTPFHYKIIARKKELEQRKTQLKNQQRQLQMEHAARDGQLGLIGELCENGIPDQMKDELNRYGEQLKGEQQEIKNRIAQVEGNIAGFRGALDNMNYLERSWL